MYASDWAAQAAVERYRPDPDKVRVVPWGANLDDYPSSAEIERLVRARPVDRCRLLFCGLDSEDRKRGGLCVEIAAELNRRGLPTELTLIGSRPTGLRAWPDFVDFVGFVDKSTVEGRARLAGALAAAHFLLFPSRAETFGHVLGEANAFGVPCLASQTGGIPTAIRDGVNGKLFALEAGASDYCDAITAHLRDVPGYHELARSAYAEFRSRLNYDAAARTALALLEARLAGVAARPRST
jgi:glycosyltransferase involved in cell wall biosynthesis